MQTVIVLLLLQLFLLRNVEGWKGILKSVKGKESVSRYCKFSYRRNLHNMAISSSRSDNGGSLMESSGLSELLNANKIATIKTTLLKYSISSNRGEISSSAEKNYLRDLVSQLEAMNPTLKPAISEACLGEWDLLYSDTQLFRSSPFFMAGRAVCKDGEEAERFNQFCDLHRAALSFTSIGRVRQVLTPGFLRSEFEATGALFPGLPFVVKGTIMSTARIETSTPDSWLLELESTRIKRGTSNIPLLKVVLDNSDGVPVQLLADVLERAVPRYETPQPVFRTLYVDEDFRVSRDQDDHIFVYVKQQTPVVVPALSS